MNNDTINKYATDALAELISDAKENNYPLNDDDFADFVDTLLIDDKTLYTEHDRTMIARRMIELCDERNISH